MNLQKELAALERMTVGELIRRYEQVVGETVRRRHKPYLVRRIAWRLQANTEGGLSERALRRAAELADPADARVTPPRPKGVRTDPSPVVDAKRAPSDPRLPPAGTMITRKYKGRTLSVVVRMDGFEFDGERYPSLSAVAKAVSGSHCNGFRFFGLEGKS
jgi:hypothetical protein